VCRRDRRARFFTRRGGVVGIGGVVGVSRVVPRVVVRANRSVAFSRRTPKPLARSESERGSRSSARARQRPDAMRCDAMRCDRRENATDGRTRTDDDDDVDVGGTEERRATVRERDRAGTRGAGAIRYDDDDDDERRCDARTVECALERTERLTVRARERRRQRERTMG
jgi:hypothetical protein